MLRVLYAEDSAIDADLTRAHCELNAPHIRLEVVDTGAAMPGPARRSAFRRVAARQPSAGHGGNRRPETADAQGLSLPVVMVTGRETRHWWFRCSAWARPITIQGRLITWRACRRCSKMPSRLSQPQGQTGPDGRAFRISMPRTCRRHRPDPTTFCRALPPTWTSYVVLSSAERCRAPGAWRSSTWCWPTFGCRTCRRSTSCVRPADRRTRVPFIIVTGKGDERRPWPRSSSAPTTTS